MAYSGARKTSCGQRVERAGEATFCRELVNTSRQCQVRDARVVIVVCQEGLIEDTLGELAVVIDALVGGGVSIGDLVRCNAYDWAVDFKE